MLDPNKHQFSLGEVCWILVDSVNSPTGRWLGKVTGFDQYHNPIAILTDFRIENSKTEGWRFQQSPSVNYRVFPKDPYIDELFERISSLEEKNSNLERFYHIRENAWKEAIAIFKK